jgi:reverse gyrase
MISQRRLSKIIQTRDSERVENYLSELYAQLSKTQRSAIKKDMKKIKNAS